MSADTVRQLLLATGALTRGSFTLSSGKETDLYVDAKFAQCNPAALELLTRLVLSRVSQVPFTMQPIRHDPMALRNLLPFVRVAGLEVGSVPLATAFSLTTGLPMLIVRKEKRVHGTLRQVEGKFDPGDPVLVLEDVTTTGGKVMGATRALRDAGLVVEHAVCIVDREEGAVEALAKVGVELHPLARLSDVRVVND